MLAVQKGDRAAFDSLVARHIDSLHSYAVRLSRNAADADDLVQEAFLNAWRKSGSYKAGKAKLTTWLHRIVHNKFIDETRKRKDLVVDADVDLIEDAETPERRHQSIESIERLDTLLRTLPENQRAAILLTYAQGFNNIEAAHILGTSVRAVESLLGRARRTLRRAFHRAEDEFE